MLWKKFLSSSSAIEFTIISNIIPQSPWHKVDPTCLLCSFLSTLRYGASSMNRNISALQCSAWPTSSTSSVSRISSRSKMPLTRIARKYANQLKAMGSRNGYLKFNIILLFQKLDEKNLRLNEVESSTAPGSKSFTKTTTKMKDLQLS